MSSSDGTMDVEGVVLFWVVLGCVFGPIMVIAYLASIIKAVKDRRKIKARQEAIRKCRLEGIPISTILHPKKPNIQVVEDPTRAWKWKPHAGSTSQLDLSNNASSEAGSDRERQDQLNGLHSVEVTVEHNPKARNGLSVHENHGGRRRKKEFHTTSCGVDNLGGSFSDISKIDMHIATIEMDNLSNDDHNDKSVHTNRSKRSSSRQVSSDSVVAGSDSELGEAEAETNPDPAPNSANKLLPNSGQHQQLSRQHIYEQHQHRPQKPKRGFKSHAFGYHNEKSSMNGSVKNLDSAEESLVGLNGVRVLVTSQSHEKDMNLVSHYTRSNRRSSYAAAIDTDYDFENASPTRSLSDDNLHRLSDSAYSISYKTPHTMLSLPDKGNVNKAFSGSAEEPFVDM